MKKLRFVSTAVQSSVFALALGVFSCNSNPSGNVGYDGYNPATSGPAPGNTFDTASHSALENLGAAQHILSTASIATKNYESNSVAIPMGGDHSAATAVDASLVDGSSDSISGSGGGSENTAGKISAFSHSGSHGSMGGSSGGAGGAGFSNTGLASLGDTRTAPAADASKTGANADGSISALSVSGLSNGSDAQGTYSGGGGSRERSVGENGFASLFGSDSLGLGAAGAQGSSETEFKRDPASLGGAGQAGVLHAGMLPMGGVDPANYFNMIHPEDNLFKIVERRYGLKTKQWALSDAQQVGQSVQVMIRK